MRLDLALVAQKLIDTRTKAKAAIENGLVFYNNQQISKPSFDVADLTQLEIRGSVMPYVSRGGLKLEKALKTFDIDLNDKTIVDIGSSTGGFTDCALQNGTKQVIAIDVGTNQLAASLRKNPQVTVYEQTDFRSIKTELIQSAQVAVSDVSFISITKMIPKLKELTKLTDIICLIKPQFECGKELADKYHGVIKDKKVHQEILNKVIKAFETAGFYLKNITYSPIQGGSGNIEYLAHFTPNNTTKKWDYKTLTDQAFRCFK